MKSRVSINVESFLYEDAKQNRINISQTTEEALRSKLAIIKGDSGNINKRLLLLQIEKLEKKVNKDSSELVQLRDQLKLVENKESEQKEIKLKEEKKVIEKLSTCPNCKNIVDEKLRVEIKKGIFLCKVCSLEKDIVKRYLK